MTTHGSERNRHQRMRHGKHWDAALSTRNNTMRNHLFVELVLFLRYFIACLFMGQPEATLECDIQSSFWMKPESCINAVFNANVLGNYHSNEITSIHSPIHRFLVYQELSLSDSLGAIVSHRHCALHATPSTRSTRKLCLDQSDSQIP